MCVYPQTLVSYYHSNLTRPAVLKKPGVIIKPAQFSKAMADELRERPTVVSKKKRVAVMSGGKPKRVKG